MARGLDSFSGKAFFRFWMLRKRLAETRRPRAVIALGWAASACGGLLVAEGILTGWFLQHIAPFAWELDFVYGRFPWVKYPQWLAALVLILIGLAGLYAGIVLARHRQLGSYFTMGLQAALIVTGAVMLYAGIRFTSSYLNVFGAINIGTGFALGALLGLCWYTLDPVGLHSEPS